jgi:hypothetical protein
LVCLASHSTEERPEAFQNLVVAKNLPSHVRRHHLGVVVHQHAASILITPDPAPGREGRLPPEQVPEGRERLFSPASLVDLFSMTIDTRNEQSDLLHACRRPSPEGLVQRFAHGNFSFERRPLPTVSYEQALREASGSEPS